MTTDDDRVMPGAPMPLAGRRVVVTRPADQAEPLCSRLRALGAEPVVVPLIEIVGPDDGGQMLDDELTRLEDYDWIVVTSANGAERVRHAVAGATGVNVAVVGSSTEEALEVIADLRPDVQTSDALADAFPDGAGRVLVVGPERDEGIEPLRLQLATKGWDVTALAAYRTVPVVPSDDVAQSVLGADAVLFASGSAVRAWVAVFGAQTPGVAVVIGPSTASVAGEMGLKVDGIAADHSLDGLVDCLLASLSDST